MRLLGLLCTLIPFLAQSQAATTEINWITWSEVEAKMEKEPRKVLVDVYTNWCGPCKIMNKTTFQDPETVAYINKHYYAIKFNAESPDEINFKGNVYKNEGYDPNRSGRNSTHDLTKAIAPANGRIAYPTIVYMDENFQILAPVQGLQRPEQIMPILSFFGEDIYKEKTWEEYTNGG
jgi:thioredoxin-related protein